MISSQLRPLNLLDDRPTDLKQFVALRAVVVAQLVRVVASDARGPRFNYLYLMTTSLPTMTHFMYNYLVRYLGSYNEHYQH